MLDFHWFLPTDKDGRFLSLGEKAVRGFAIGNRPASISYLGRVVGAAEEVGFSGALVPTGYWCNDAWIVASMLVGISKNLRFMVAARPGLMSPTLAAQMSASFQELSGGRLMLNIVAGGESSEQRAYGDFADKVGRYGRTAEYIELLRLLWSGEPVTFEGQFLRVEEAKLSRPPSIIPPIYFGGSSAAAGPVAARHADVYLSWAEPPDLVREKISWIRDLTAAENRTARFGLRVNVITRNTSAEAWAEADRMLAAVDPAYIDAVQDGLTRTESEGQRRMVLLHQGRRDNLEIYPNLWAGVGLVRGGSGTAIVGSHQEVAERIIEYSELGITEFILSGIPHVEEAYWFGEGVLPILESLGMWSFPQRSAQGGSRFLGGLAGGVPNGRIR